MKSTEYFKDKGLPLSSTRYGLSEYGSLWQTSDTSPNWAERIVYTLPFLAFGDYTGSAVEESNVRYVREVYAPLLAEGILMERRESYGTEMILLCETDVPEELSELMEDFVSFIYGLEEYPLADEGLHSEVEMERQAEAMEQWATQEFIDKVAPWDRLPNINDMLNDYAPSWTIQELFDTCMERANEYWVDESCGMYIDVERIAKHVKGSDILRIYRAC